MGQSLYIIGQVLGVFAVVLGFINYQVKTRKQVLFVNIATTLCFAFHYMLLGAYAGMALNFIGFLRNIVYYYAEKKNQSSKLWAIAFTVIMGVMGILSWEAWYSVFVILGLMINSYALSFSNPNNLRKSILISSPIVIVYDCFTLSFGGIVYESMVIISSVIGIIRFSKKREERYDG